MSLKGYFRRSFGGWVYLREWYTGLRWKVPETKAYFYKSIDGITVMADKKDAVLY